MAEEIKALREALTKETRRADEETAKRYWPFPHSPLLLGMSVMVS